MSKLYGAYYLEGWLCIAVVVCSLCCCFVLFAVAYSLLLGFLVFFSSKKKVHQKICLVHSGRARGGLGGHGPPNFLKISFVAAKKKKKKKKKKR